MTDTEDRPMRVFLCHAKDDKPFVRQLYDFLRKNGVDAWFDEEKILPGQDWELEISKALRETDAIVVCLSKRSINKEGFVQKEILFALDRAAEMPEGTIFIIPARIEMFEDHEFPRRLSQWQWVDLFGKQGGERLLRGLSARAEKLGLKIPRTPLAAARIANPSAVSSGDKAALMTAKPSSTIRPKAAHVVSKVWADIEFIKIPGGEFIIGNKLTDPMAIENETPRHTVDIPYDFWMSRFPITNFQFSEFIGWTHYSFVWEEDWKSKLNHPVINISWEDAQEYLRWLNKRFQKDLPKDKFRLPSEAEWEKAARGEDGRIWPWGNTFDKTKCNSKEGGVNAVTPVDAYTPQGDSPYGVADMAGNVWEWTGTKYLLYPYDAEDGRENFESGDHYLAYPSTRYRQVLDLGKKIVVRGGSFTQDAQGVRSACRNISATLNHKKIEASMQDTEFITPIYFHSPQGLRIVVGR